MRVVCVVLSLLVTFAYFDLSAGVLTLESTGRIETCPNNLTVYCNLTEFNKIPDVAALVSMVISRRDNETNSMVDLVSVNAFSGQITTHQHLNGTYEGKLDKDGVSFLRLQYDTPARELVTDFMCEAHAITMFGRPVKFSAKAQVAEINPDNMAPNVMPGGPSNASLNVIDDYLFFQQKAENVSLSNLFSESGTYQGHKYLLAKRPLKYDIAWISCSQHGGYLAELNSQDEYDFVKSFLTSENLRYQYYVTGAVYQNSTYTFLRNPDAGIHLDVKGNESGTPGCLSLNKNDNYLMYGTKCSGSNDVSSHRSFICEVPATSASA
jgi:hypothetical protein